MRRRRIEAFAFWTCALGLAVSCLVAVTSMFLRFVWEGPNCLGYAINLNLQAGSLQFWFHRFDPEEGLGFYAVGTSLRPQWWSWWSPGTLMIARWDPFLYMFIPLWLPVVLFASATIPLAVRRRRAKWRCRCGYDLRGLKAEKCPECGKTLPSAKGQSVA